MHAYDHLCDRHAVLREHSDERIVGSRDGVACELTLRGARLVRRDAQREAGAFEQREASSNAG
jgi:hypothetical protein